MPRIRPILDRPLLALALTLAGAACDSPSSAPRPASPPAQPIRQQVVLQPSFQETTVISGRARPTAVKFAADGRVFVAEQGGKLWVYASLGDGAPKLFADLSVATYSYWDRGLLGLALHPQFPAQPFVYVLYTLNQEPGNPTIPRWPDDKCPDAPAGPGGTDMGCVAGGRVSRLEMDPATGAASSETVLLEGFWQQYPSHSSSTPATRSGPWRSAPTGRCT